MKRYILHRKNTYRLFAFAFACLMALSALSGIPVWSHAKQASANQHESEQDGSEQEEGQSFFREGISVNIAKSFKGRFDFSSERALPPAKRFEWASRPISFTHKDTPFEGLHIFTTILKSILYHSVYALAP